MSKKVQMDAERKETVIQEFVDMYIANEGQMPTARMIKKNRYISEDEVNLLRNTGVITESKIRRMAEEKTGREFISAEERRRKEQLAKARLADIPLAQSVPVQEMDQKQEVDAAMTTEKVHRGRGHGLTKEEVLADLKALVERLGHVPSQAEIAKVENGAQFSYPTYLNKLGPKSEWLKALGMAPENEPDATPVEETKDEPAAAPVEEANPVAEPDVVPVVTPAEEACDDEWETIEIPAFSVKVPKALKGKMSIMINLD